MKKLLLLILFSTIFTNKISAQWVQTNGPYGAEVNCMIARDSNLIVGVGVTSYNGAIFYSSNYGNSWKCVFDNLSNSLVLCLASDGNNLYAGTYYGIYNSTDGGESWDLMNNSLSSTSISGIVITGGNIIVGTYYGIYLSNDNGNTWNLSNTGLTNLNISGLKSDGTNIFATIYGNGVSMSNDSGLTWTSLNNGLTDLNVKCLITRDSTLLAGTQTGGVFYSNNLGINWTSIGLQGSQIHSVGISDSTIFAGSIGGMYITNDYGNTWLISNNGLSNHHINEILVKDTLIFACTLSGLHVSSDLGNSWHLTGVPAIDIPAMTHFGDHIFAGSVQAPGSNSGVFLSTNNGDSWKTVNNGLPTGAQIMALQSIGTKVFASVYSKGIYLSSDSGASWTAVNNGLVDSILFVLSAHSGNLYTGATNGKIYFSNDSAQNWTLLTPIAPLNSSSHISGIEFIGQSIFVSNNGYLCNNIYRSDDNGLTWDSLNITTTNITVTAFVAKGTSLYAVGDQFYRSDDLGVTWVPSWNGSSNLWINALATDGTNLYAGTTYDGSFYYSTDNGFNWVIDNTGLPDSTNLDFRKFIITPNYLFASIGSSISKLSVVRRPLSDLTNNHELTNKKIDFEVYPNPSSDHITIKFSKEITVGKIEIINAIGQTLFSDEIKNSSFKEIQLHNKFAGICVVKITSDQSSQAKIIVKESY